MPEGIWPLKKFFFFPTNENFFRAKFGFLSWPKMGFSQFWGVVLTFLGLQSSQKWSHELFLWPRYQKLITFQLLVKKFFQYNFLQKKSETTRFFTFFCQKSMIRKIIKNFPRKLLLRFKRKHFIQLKRSNGARFARL